MKRTCQECDRFDKCKELCEDIRAKIELSPNAKRYAPTEEKIVSQLSGNLDKDGEEKAPTIDDARKIDLGRLYDNQEDLNRVWDQQIYPKSYDPDTETWKMLMECIDFATRKSPELLKRQFRAFLRCKKIVRVAKMGNTSYQDIQTKFHRIIRRFYQRLKNERKLPRLKGVLSPNQFKIKFNFNTK